MIYIEVFNFNDMTFKTTLYSDSKPVIEADLLYQQKFNIDINETNINCSGCICAICDENHNVIYTGIIKTFEPQRISVSSFLEHFNLYFAPTTFSGIIENLIKNGITNYYITNTDVKQNLPYLIINTPTQTTGTITTTEEERYLSSILLLSFKKYQIVLEVNIDLSDRKIIINIEKKGINNFKLNTDIPDLVIERFDFNKPLTNKIEYRLKDEWGTIKGIYYLLVDGTTTTDSINPNRVLPVEFERKPINNASENLAELSKQDMASNIYNQDIILSISIDNRVIKEHIKNGSLLSIYHKDIIIKTITTGVTYNYTTNRIIFKCGIIRTSTNALIKKLTGGF